MHLVSTIPSIDCSKQNLGIKCSINCKHLSYNTFKDTFGVPDTLIPIYSWCLQCSEIKSGVFDVVQSIVPSRMYSTLKGGAIHEYLSSLRHISRSEASRLAQGFEKTTRRRRYELSMSN